MSILEDFEKDKLWNRMQDMKIVGMTRASLNHDDGIVRQLTNKL